MQEALEQISRYARGIWRYRWYAVGSVVAIAVLGWVFVSMMPNRYAASAKVYVDTDTLLAPLLKGIAVEAQIDERIQLINRTLLSRPNLAEVIDRTPLLEESASAADQEKLVNRLAEAIKVEQVVARKNLYTISYEHRDPELARQVVDAVLAIFVERTRGEARADSGSAQRFLEQQIKEYEARLVKAEERLMLFKRRNMGMLPDQSGDFFERLQLARQQLEQAELELQEAVYRRDELRRQLGQVQAGAAVAGHTVVTSVDTRIRELRARLDQLQLSYTQEHPDVKEGQRTLARLERQQKEELQALADGTATQRIVPEGESFNDLNLALGESEADLAAKQVRVKEFRGRIQRLNEQADTLPQIEAELKRLNRDYGVNKENYEVLVQRRESAKLAQQVEASGDNLKFRVIDPPVAPVVPSGPNRVQLSTMVLFASLFGGLGVAFVMAENRPAVHDRTTLEKFSGIPVFGVVSMTRSAAQLKQLRNEYAMIASVLLLLVTAYGWLLWSFYTEEVQRVMQAGVG